MCNDLLAFNISVSLGSHRLRLVVNLEDPVVVRHVPTDKVWCSEKGLYA